MVYFVGGGGGQAPPSPNQYASAPPPRHYLEQNFNPPKFAINIIILPFISPNIFGTCSDCLTRDTLNGIGCGSWSVRCDSSM